MNSKQAKRVSICIQGGLGNQLFQYAAARAASIKLNARVELDTSFFAGRQREDAFEKFRRSFLLSELCVDYREVGVFNRNESIGYRLIRKVRNSLSLGGLAVDHRIVDREWTNWDFPHPCRKVNLLGYWIGYKYFSEIEAVIRKEFRPKRRDQLNDSLAERLVASGRTIVGVHIRRGDIALSYADSSVPRTGYRLLDLSYYETAMSMFPGALFVITSDDPDWATEKLEGRDRIIARGGGEVEDLFLLASCDHQIIANSTFSWWAAWLNQRADKRVVAPAHWFENGFQLAIDEDEFLPGSWIRL